MNYYTAVIVMSWLALAVLSILVSENDRLPREDKRLLYLTYALIAASALMEWLGIRLNGDPSYPEWLLRTVKCADYILTPAIAVALVMQLRSRSVWSLLISIIVLINTPFQLIAVFSNWMLVVDSQNRYSHGLLYPVYTAAYLLLIALVIIEFAVFGRSFRRKNRASLIALILMVVVGIMIQELLGSEYRIAYLALTLGVTMLFIHNAEFTQIVTDDRLEEQRIELMLSQIQPHFLYNTLGAIARLCQNEPDAKNAINEFARYLRGNMDSLFQTKPIPFLTELEHTKLYLELERLRFEDDLTVLYDIECTDFMLPSLTLQPLAENAVKHGVRSREDGKGTVTISTRDYPDRWEIIVTDNGPGFHPNDDDGRSHVGLKNIRERLLRISGGLLQLETPPDGGCRATIILLKEGKSLEDIRD